MRRVSIAVMVALASLAIGVVGADAVRVHHHNTKVTIHFRSGTYADTFHGKVKSGFDRCKRHRKVIVKKVRPGKDKRIGSDESNGEGKWSLNLGDFAAPGRYYAKAPRKELSRRHVCDGDKSRTIQV